MGIHEFLGLVGSGTIAVWPAIVPVPPPAMLRPVTGGREAPLQILSLHRHHPDVDQFCHMATRLATAS